MPNNRIHFEEAHTEKIDSLTLVSFFKKFFSPYKKYIAGAAVLAVCAIGTELLLPQLLRVVLDRYITTSARKVFPAGELEGLDFYKRYENSFIRSDKGNTFFILPSIPASFSEQNLQQLEEKGILAPEKYYPVKVDINKSEIIDKYNDVFMRAGEFAFVSYGDLSQLDKADVYSLRDDDIKGITRISGVFIVMLFLSFILNFSQIYLVEYTSQNIMHDLRTAVFTHLQVRCMAFFTRNPVGRLVTRATNDVQNLHEMFNALFANMLKDICMIFGIMTILFIINWKLSMVCFAVLPFLICCTAFFSVKSRAAFREVRIKIAALNAKAQENISGISVVKSFCREVLNQTRFQKINHENYIANMKQTMVFAVFNPIVDLTRMSAIALIIWYGGGKAVREGVSLGTLVVFLYYMRMFFRPIQDLAEKYNIIQSAVASLERIYLLFSDTATIDDPQEPRALGSLSGNIEFRNVSFSYNKDEPVLHDVSFSVKQGETVAIVGPTGAGKTTIINLLERFYDVQEGCICIDGIDIRTMKKSFLRRHIGLVMQDVFLFAGTIKSNIALDAESINDKRIESALETANAGRLIQRLPNGINEDVKEGGRTLSAGERQLLSFARAILINPTILILDEATSNIDSVTEGLIQDALEKLMKDRTSLVIAHRFSTIRKADNIIVMHKGRIHEQGTHEELLRKQGLYYQLYELQFVG